MLELCFVTASRANAFMAEILDAVAAAVRELGVATSFAVDELPAREGDVAYVAIPHELFPFLPPERQPEPELLARTVSLCVEHPGTVWFEISADWARQTGAALDINRSSVAELRRRGIPAEHVQLGYSSVWDRWGGDRAAPRPTDVVYLGSTDARRDAFLASYAATLYPRRCHLAIPPIAPKTGPAPGYHLGSEKLELLAQSKVLLNLHRGDSRSLEWVRVLEAMANGCVVVSEHSLDAEPLEPGVHFVSAEPENLAELADHLLERPGLLDRLRAEAYRFLREELTMRDLAERVVATAEAVARSAPPLAGPARPGRGPLPPEQPAAAAPPDLSEEVDLRVAVKGLSTQLTELRRSIDDLRTRIAGETADLVEVARTPAYERPAPRVTVGISLYEYEREIVDALASVVASRYADYDVVVVDDASRDGSVAAVERFLADRPWLPAAVYRRRVNGGPAAVRNAVAELSRGELLLVLDADNGVYPTCLERLVEALDADPDASFAYPMLDVRSGGRSTFLWNRLAWDPARLAEESYLDAFALVRREHLLELGGYRDDPRLDLEDYDLWCRFADAGRHGVHVPEPLGWYRLTGHSRLRTALTDRTVALSLVREGSPSLFGA
jgi:hypothetical protein